MGNNILIVDDAAFMRMMVKDILTKGGYNVVGKLRMVLLRFRSIQN